MLTRSHPSNLQTIKSTPNTSAIHESCDAADISVPILEMRDIVLNVVGKLDSLSARVSAIEHRKLSNSSINDCPQSTTIMTQTETESDDFPPACHKQALLWGRYVLSQKSETQILIDALKTWIYIRCLKIRLNKCRSIRCC